MALLRNLTGTTPVSGDAPNVADVFSTYLYEGTGSAQDINNGINLGDFGVGTSTEFDGTNDYLSRSSDLTGNTDGKTFTFSAWFYTDSSSGQHILRFAEMEFKLDLSSSTIPLRVTESNNTIDIRVTNTGSLNTWNHVLISLDLTNPSNRYVYVNDEAASVTWSVYTNANLDRTGTLFEVGAKNGGSKLEGSLAHVFLDYTYRDLSVGSNRRLFIDANGGSTPPTTLSALNPIMYLPMTDGYSIGENLGTGGDFTSNGSPTIIDKGTEYVVGSGEGGMVWIKGRDQAVGTLVWDTTMSPYYNLSTYNTDAIINQTAPGGISSANSTGFSIGSTTWTRVNSSGNTYASWTFRKAPRFFDVVTYTGNGNGSPTANQTISHNLGVAPGMIIIKRLDSVGNWPVYHRSNTANPETDVLFLDTAAATTDDEAYWYDTAPTSTEFTVGKDSEVNASSGTYVAYLFAHDPLGESGDGSDGMIACGSVASSAIVDLGWEPQYILVKRHDLAGHWMVVDTLRGCSTDSGGTPSDAVLEANTSDAESVSNYNIYITPTGFKNNVENNIYMAIRAPMMKEPESATEVFAIDTRGSTGDGKVPAYRSTFPVDLSLYNKDSDGSITSVSARLTGTSQLYAELTNAEAVESGAVFDHMNGMLDYTNIDPTKIAWMFKRAKGFFDVVAYTGTGVARTVAHNLGVAPEMMIVKNRSDVDNWAVYIDSIGGTKFLRLNSSQVLETNSGYWNDTNATATEFTVGSENQTNGAGGNAMIAYLFATLDGISKVGSYTGNGSSQNIACGFSAGARFVLIKRTDATGDWYIWDTTRGIVTGNDPHLSLNTQSAEVTTDDSVDPESAGFTVNQVSATNINVTSATYIFYAIA